MGDIEMTMSQVAYNQLDYPPTFWDAVLNMDQPLTSTQSSSGSETVIGSASTSLTDVADANGAAATLGPATPNKTTSRLLKPPSQPANALQVNQSPSISPGSKPSMAPPRAIPSAGSSGNLFGTSGPKRETPLPTAGPSRNPNGASGTKLKRLSSETGLPPAKMRRLDTSCIRRGSSSRNIPVPRVNIPAAGVKPVSGGSSSEVFALQFLFHGHHGRDLQPFVISHSAEVQPVLDTLQIARGVQWELVRGIKSGVWTWDDVKLKIDELKGPNALIAPAVRNIMRGAPARSYTSHERSLWEELDREAKATVENKSRGLGLMGDFEGVSDYYGGNVQCTIRLLYTADGEMPNVRLEPLQMTRSHHLARELGSVSVIALRDDKDGTLVKQWALRKFILCGRTYIALPPKSNKVYLIETNEDYARIAQEWCGDQHRISYDDYIRKNNPMHLNANQPFAKYLTRLNLYLSTSIPVLEFHLDNIMYIDDKYADGWSKSQRPPTETIMTDGCGFLNRAAALKISARLKYERLPVAYQGRIAGSKGLWVIHPSDDSPEPRIWIRDSQKKIKLSRVLRAHRIFDLLAVSGPSSSSHLSAQSIVILANNGVPASVFCTLQEQGLKDLITPLMDWKRPHATAYLWNAINDVSNVTRSRLQRLAAGASRALGFEKRAREDADYAEDLGDIDPDLELAHSGRNSYSGEPLIVPDAAMDLLQAGFDPLEAPFLSFKIHNLIKSTMESFLTRYRIPLATSFEAYIIPDPSEQLEEGQVFYKSSRDCDGPLREQVVVGRYPMRESSDMQKVTAVDIPALAGYVDVLVISIRGSRSLASLLAGGDTDGDEAIIIRELAIVEPFQNQPVVPLPDGFLTTNFEQQVQTVTDFGKKLEKMPIAQAQQAFQVEVMAGLEDNRIGVYSLNHDTAVYEWGLNDPKTRRMAHMTATLLDASKTGLRLKKEVEEADQRLFGRIPRAKCFDASKGVTRKRNSKLGPFVLESLLAAGVVTKDQLQATFETSVASHLKSDESSVDPDIEEPYHRMTRASVGDTPLAIAIASDLKLLRDRIVKLREEYDNLSRQLAQSKSEPQTPWESNQSRKKGPPKQSDNCMLPIMRAFRQPFEGLQYLHLTNIDEIKASYAFLLVGYKFGFSMAFQDICEIKRRAEMKRGPYNRVAVIDDAKSMGGPARRLLKHMGDEG
ncbi:RNA dependent RNA polymerase-domain-containing protein [Mycena capillaripes]|nr:RNA dependent RNA polymerase-domain-containing protein [Mycena capillaripes]